MTHSSCQSRRGPLFSLWVRLAVALSVAIGLAPTAAQSTAVVGTSDPNAALALTDVATSYQMLSPSLAIDLLPPVSETDALSKLLDGTLDFLSTTMALSPLLTTPASPLYAAAARDLLWWPYLVAPLVPIYRLDSLTATGTTAAVALSAATLCSIYTGDIVAWNDSRLSALNPSLTLPSTAITVVVEAVPSSLTAAFTLAMAAACSQFALSIGVTAQPVWPTASYAGYVASLEPASTVLVVDGAIGFTSLPIALVADADVAAMWNDNNQSVTASALSATFAATELLAQATSSTALTSHQSASASPLLPAVLVNPVGQQAWPMTLVSAFVLHANTTSNAGSCETRAALVSFINFMYSSSAAAAALANRQYATYPTAALSELSLPALLQTSVLCENGSTAYAVASSQSLQSASVVPTSHTLHGDSRFTSVLSLVAGLFTEIEQAAGNNIDVSYEGTSDIWVGVEAVMSGEAEAALVTLDLLSLTQQAELMAARDSGRFYLLPLFVSATIPVYNPVLTSNLSLPSTLTMDPVTLITVAGFYVTDWASPLLAPSIAPLALGNLTTPLPIQFVSPCNSTAPGSALREYYSLFTPYAPTLPAFIYNSSSVLYSECDSAFYDSSAYIAGQPHGLFPAPTESAVPAIVNAVSGSMSFQRATASVEPAVIYVDFGVGVGGVTANVSSMLACLDSFDASTMTAALNASTNSSCYLFSRTVYVLVPASIVDAAGDSCAARAHMLDFLQQLTATDSFDALLDDQLLVRAGKVQAVQVAVLDALNSIACVDPSSGEWDTLLVQTPVEWSLSRAVTIVGLSLGCLGIVCAVASFAITAAFRRHSVIRAASPVFLSLTLLGLAVMFVSSLLLSLPPSTASCAGLSWSFHLGFQLAFAPLLAKTYRIYRIYGGQKLSVVKLSNTRLALIVTALLAVELGLLAALQIVSPMRPLIVSRTSGSPLRLHEYSQCSVDSRGLPLFLALCIEKGAVLLVGALMAFSTRRVSSTYSESSGIAWSIYNLILSMAVLVPLVLLIDAVGDTLVALLLFALLWISAFTLCVLFVPRLAGMLSKAEALDEHDSGARVVGDNGFSFLSLASFEAGGTAMGQYVAALETHLAQAKARHSQLKQGDTKGKDWMKATAGRKQSIASVNSSTLGRGQQQAEQKRAREKSIATVTAAPKASLSYTTQTRYSPEPARSNIARSSLAQSQRAKSSVATSGQTQQLPSDGSHSPPTMAESLAANTTRPPHREAVQSGDPSGLQTAELHQQHSEPMQQPASTVDDASGLTIVETVQSGRPSSNSRSRSSRVQPLFDKAASAQSARRDSGLRAGQVAGGTQLDDHSEPAVQPQPTQQPLQEQAQADRTVALSTQLQLPALPVADDMVVHDLSSRLPRAAAHEEDKSAAYDSTLTVRPATVLRPRANSSRGILITPVTGSSATLSPSSGDSRDRPAGETRDAEHIGELDIEAGEAMQDIE